MSQHQGHQGHQASQGQGQSSLSTSRTDADLIKVVTVVCVVVLITYIPGELASMVSLSLGKSRHNAEYRFVLNFLHAFSMTMYSVNASINLLVYLKLSSNFRATFVDMWRQLKARLL